MSDIPKEQKDQESFKTTLLSFTYELGISIVVPLIIFVFLGVWFDKRFDTKPLGIIIGLLLSFIPTTMSIAKKVKKFNE